jgi:hypothetical protein
MSRMSRLLAGATVLLTLLALAPAAVADTRADAAKSCRVGDSRSYNTTYVLSISVSGTRCRPARKVIRAFHACRPGKSGRCDGVLDYSCSESRFDKIRTQYSGRVTCTKGGKTVKHTYTQFI